MVWNLFGKKKTPPQQPRAGSVSTSGTHPWDGAPDYAVANFALGDLINNLPKLFSVGGRIHAETLLAASGAIAGYAAQQALFAKLTDAGQTPVSGGLHVVQSNDGHRYYFGDPLNWMLVPQSNSVEDALERLWPYAAGGAVAAGLDPTSVPPFEPMFAHVAATIGGEKEGTTSIEKYHFQHSAKDLLKAAWPLALKCFESKLSGKVIQPPMVVSQRWRPTIAAITANKMIRDVAVVVRPADALTIVMEIAIYASKLDIDPVTAS